MEEAQKNQMYNGFSNSTTTISMFDQEEAIRKSLVDDMIKYSTPSNAPTVKVLTNLQGKNKFDLNMKIVFFLHE